MMQCFLKLTAARGLVLIVGLLHTCKVQGASLWQYKLHGSEMDGKQTGPFLLPSADMMKALEYVQSLRKGSNKASHEEASPDYEEEVERLRSLLRLAPVQNQEEPEEFAGYQDDKKLWLKGLLRTLQPQTPPAPAPASPPHSRFAHSIQPNVQNNFGQKDTVGDYGEYSSPQRSRPHRKYSLIFEDEDSRESPYKRTNENVDEQYTPQNLATLQSVFEELGKLSALKGHKRQSFDDIDDNDLYRINNLAYDVAGGEEWTPVEEKVETEEEVKDSREEFDRSSDEDEDESNISDEDDDNNIKRSIQQTREQEEPDDFTKLVDYYLLKILEKTEQTEQKRDNTGEQNTGQPLTPASYDVDPQAIYRLIEISEKLQISPEELLELLKDEEFKKKERVQEPKEAIDDLDRVEEKLTQIAAYNKDKSPTTKLYNRQQPGMYANKILNDLTTEGILNGLGMESLGNQKPAHLHLQRKPKNTQTRHYTPSGRRGNYILPDPSVSDKRGADYDDTLDEDELATYLAAKMLAQYPKVMNKMDNKRNSQPSSKDEQLAFGTFEQALLDYFDQLAAEKSSPAKRLLESDNRGASPQMQQLDDETLLKVLEYLNPETGENEERDLYGKNIGGM